MRLSPKLRGKVRARIFRLAERLSFGSRKTVVFRFIRTERGAERKGEMAVPVAKNSRKRGASNAFQWASGFLFAGTSALLLLLSNLFPAYGYISILALLPFLYKVVKADRRAALRLGFLFGLAFFSISFIGSLLTAPFAAILKLGSGIALFALFGWAASWAKEKYGFNPLTVALLWVVFELALIKTGTFDGVFSEAQPTAGFFYKAALLFGFLAISFVIVLFDSLLILAAEKTVALLAKAGQVLLPEFEKIFDFSPAFGPLPQKVYLVPEGRAPPLSP